MEHTIYAYWNGKAIYDVLNSVVLITGGSEAGAYRQLMASVALMGLLVAVGVAIARVRATDMMTTFIALTFFYGVFFLPKATVYIDDVRLNHNYHVENVPLGLALFGSVTSKVGYWLTNAYETYFTAVDDEKFSRYGFLFGSRLVEELPRTTYHNAMIQDNARRFMLNCVNPELDENPQKLAEMLKTNDMWKFVSGQGADSISVNPGRITPWYDMWHQAMLVLPCASASGNVWDYDTALGNLNLDTLVGTFAEIQLLGKIMHRDDDGSSIWTEIPTFETTMTGISRAAYDTMRHYALINIAREANEDRAAVLAATMATQQMETGYKVMRLIAEGALPKIRNMVELLVYAIFPIVFLIVVGAGAAGGKVLTMYAMTAVWVQLWAPLYAVINSFMHRLSANAIYKLTNGNGGTIELLPHMISMSASDLAIAGLLTISVPAIALAIVKGGAVAMSGVVNSLMSPGQGAAAKTGGEVGLGNISVGRVAAGGADLRGDTTKTMPQTTLNTPHGSLSYGPDNTLAGARPNTFGTAGASVGAANESRLGSADREISGARWNHGNYTDAGTKTAARFTEADSAEFMRRLGSNLTTSFGASWNQSVSGRTSDGRGADTHLGGGTNLNTGETAELNTHGGVNIGGKDQTDIRATGQSSATTTEPGGSVSGGKPGAGQAAAGRPATATTHSNALSRARTLLASLGVDLGMGGGTRVAQTLADVVRNENGQFTRKQQETAAQILHAAVNDVMGSTSDEGVRAAGRKFAAEHGVSAESSNGEKAEVGRYHSTDRTIEQSNAGTTSGQVASETAVWKAARAMVDAEGTHSGAIFGISGATGDIETMRRLVHDENFRAKATRLAMAATQGAHEPLTGNADRSTPADEAAILAAGEKHLEAVKTAGDALVAKQSAAATNNVQTRQPVSPTSSPSLQPAAQAHAAAANAAQALHEEQGQQAQLNAGINSLGAQLHRNKDHGMSKVLSIFFAGAAGYDSPGAYVQALQQAARQDPQLATQLRSYADGRAATKGELQQIFDRAKQHLR